MTTRTVEVEGKKREKQKMNKQENVKEMLPPMPKAAQLEYHLNQSVTKARRETNEANDRRKVLRALATLAKQKIKLAEEGLSLYDGDNDDEEAEPMKGALDQVLRIDEELTKFITTNKRWLGEWK